MNVIVSFLAVILLMIIAYVGVDGLDLRVVFGVIVPYLAVFAFFAGLVYRIVDWAKSPVPFRIPTTGGQEKSFDWIKQSKLDNPSSTSGVVGRMILEVLAFRSLFRNTKLDFREGPRISYSSEKFLWLFAILFHYSFLTVLVRHLRFFTDPVPVWVTGVANLDSLFKVEPFEGFLSMGLPAVLLSGLILGGAVTLLLVRRLVIPGVRYISLAADYFPLFLILAICGTGIAMRYGIGVSIVDIKKLTMGLVQFSPALPEGVSVWFYVHLFLVCTLFAYIPFSKITHMAGIFMSPTRNLANTSRSKRHVNPWNYPVKVHSYEAYEDDFRENMIEVGLPVDKMPEPSDDDEQGEKE